MFRVLRDVRQRLHQSSNKRRRAVVRALTKRLPRACHVPGKVVGLELEASTLFQDELTAKQAPQNVFRLELQEHIIIGALNTRSDKHPTRLSAWNEEEGEL
eukprot:1266975-Heterocapsa_arctica.AAC.1